MKKENYIKLLNSNDSVGIIYAYWIEKGGTNIGVNKFVQVLNAWLGFDNASGILDMCIDYYDAMFEIVKFEYNGNVVILN